MLKHIYTIVLSAALIMLVSCSKDSNDEPGLTPDEEPVEVVVTVLEGAFAPNETGPRMVIEADGWSIIEYRTNGEEHEEMTHLHFLNPDYKASIVISGFDKGAIIYEYDIMTRKPSSEVYLTHESGNNLIVSLCNMDWQTLKYDIISESVVEMKNNRALTRGAYEDDIRNIFIRLLDNISQNISEFCETTSWFSKSNAISLIGSIWTKVAIPCAKYQLLNEVPENTPEIEDELIEISNDLPINYSTHILFSLIPCNFNRLLIHTYDIFIDYYTRIASYQQPTEEEVYESFDIITRISNKSYPLIEAADGYIPAYKVDLSVTDVTETSAVLNGSSTALGSTYPYISSMGYEVDGTDGYHKNILSDMMNSITIDGLTPGTEYRVTAYLNSMGHRYERSVRFYTDISLKLYPNSLLFSAEGGSKGVALSIPRDNLKSWDIVSKPKWCTIEMGASSFFVDVPASKKERRGEIVVKAITLNGKSYSASVDVQQKKAYWDGTEWNCSGTVKETIEGETIPLNFGISIRGVANNDFSLSGSAAGLESMAKIRIDGEKLVMEYNYNYNDESGMITASGNMIIIFTRTNDSSLSFTLSGKVHASVNGISKGGTLSGSGTGTLVTE